jgi:2-polyprenyl-3-methyl-5-hydroxy-6-metoxy-1,4-benzoquinol methylase
MTSEWPPEGLVPVGLCPICGEPSRSLLYDGLSDRVYLCAPGRWILYRCERCTTVYLDPRPSSDSVALAYETYYGDEEILPEAESTSRLRGLRRSLRNGYVNARYNQVLVPSLALGRLALPLLPRHREEADTSVRHLRRESGSSTLLDVGCGDGEFLSEMKAGGWRVHGLEPNAIAASLARKRGVSIHEGVLTDNLFPAEFFDAVTFRLVIEHLHNPLETIRICLKILRPGGFLWVLTPNLESEGHRIFGCDWIFLDVPRHPVLFTPESFKLALVRTGFELICHRPSRRAQWTFEKSAAIADGYAPFEHPPRLSPALRWKASVADLRSRWRPERAEEAIFISRKPNRR